MAFQVFENSFGVVVVGEDILVFQFCMFLLGGDVFCLFVIIDDIMSFVEGLYIVFSYVQFFCCVLQLCLKVFDDFI